jgi:hypothetical protein
MAVDWTLPRAPGTGLRFVRVDYTTRLELEELTTIKPGGDITRTMVDLKVSGTLSAVAPPALGDDLIRVYYDVVDIDGNEESVVLGTMHAVKAGARYTEAAESADLTLLSALLTLQGAKLLASLTLPAATVAATYAEGICTTLGLPYVSAPSTRALTVAMSFDAGTSYLAIVNALLDFAGFWSAQVDNDGRVVFEAYESPMDRAPVYEFIEGANCVYLPDVSVQSDAYNVPNVVVLTASNAAGAISGSYENDDASSPYSTANRREIALVETVSDAVDAADLNARAYRRWLEATGAAETLTVSHAYLPNVAVGDVVLFAWTKHGISMRATVQSQGIALNAACMTTSALKRIGDY